MEKEVVLLDADETQCKDLCDILSAHSYKTARMNSLADTVQYLEKRDCRALILNLDNTLITNKNLRELKQKKPMVNIIAFSERQFHPELEEALREYISVCLAKPVDSEELMYWLKSIFKNNEKQFG